MFACQSLGVTPAIMVMAKAIANGLPLGGIIARKELMQSWTVSAHGGTFGGNPVCCAASLATIAVIESGKLAEKAEKTGKYLVKKLKALQKTNKEIGDVRGMGLMVGVEFIKENGDPDPEKTKKVISACLENGLLLISCGSHDQVIRFIPPLTIKKKQIDEALNVFEKALGV